MLVVEIFSSKNGSRSNLGVEKRCSRKWIWNVSNSILNVKIVTDNTENDGTINFGFDASPTRGPQTTSATTTTTITTTTSATRPRPTRRTVQPTAQTSTTRRSLLTTFTRRPFTSGTPPPPTPSFLDEFRHVATYVFPIVVRFWWTHLGTSLI